MLLISERATGYSRKLGKSLPVLGWTVAEFNQSAVGCEMLSNNDLNYKIEPVNVLLTDDLVVDAGAAVAGEPVSSAVFLIDCCAD